MSAYIFLIPSASPCCALRQLLRNLFVTHNRYNTMHWYFWKRRSVESIHHVSLWMRSNTFNTHSRIKQLSSTRLSFLERNLVNTCVCMNRRNKLQLRFRKIFLNSTSSRSKISKRAHWWITVRHAETNAYNSVATIPLKYVIHSASAVVFFSYGSHIRARVT